MELILFWFFAIVAVVTAVFVISFRSPLHIALSLIGSFFALAGVYILLRAHLLAALQVLVYAGAVMVLFVFVIMLLNLNEEELGTAKPTGMKVLGGVGLGAGLALFAWVGQRGQSLASGGVLAAKAGADGFGTGEWVGGRISGK